MGKRLSTVNVFAKQEATLLRVKEVRSRKLKRSKDFWLLNHVKFLNDESAPELLKTAEAFQIDIDDTYDDLVMHMLISFLWGVLW